MSEISSKNKLSFEKEKHFKACKTDSFYKKKKGGVLRNLIEMIHCCQQYLVDDIRNGRRVNRDWQFLSNTGFIRNLHSSEFFFFFKHNDFRTPHPTPPPMILNVEF